MSSRFQGSIQDSGSYSENLNILSVSSIKKESFSCRYGTMIEKIQICIATGRQIFYNQRYQSKLRRNPIIRSPQQVSALPPPHRCSQSMKPKEEELAYEPCWSVMDIAADIPKWKCLLWPGTWHAPTPHTGKSPRWQAGSADRKSVV